MRHQARLIFDRSWSGGVCIGLLGFFLVVMTIDPAGNYPDRWAGPGITVDESFNVQQGLLLVELFRAYGLFMFDPANTQQIFDNPAEIPFLPDHPPLGRWILGLSHHIGWQVFPPESNNPNYCIATARHGSAILYGLTIFLVGSTAGRWWGSQAGWFSALALLLMPRVFAHAHLASLETAVNFFYTLACLSLAEMLARFQQADQAAKENKKSEQNQVINWKSAIGPGLCLGLAMLTKIQGFLLIPVSLIAILIVMRQRAWLPLLVWGLMANLIFFLGWPWLWLDPLGHLQQFLGSATDRVALHNYYFGQVNADTDTPWHYPWVMFLVTVPVGLHLLGFFGLWQAIRLRITPTRLMFVAGCLLFPLLLFSTRTAVYDGERLFLMVFPLWALLVGLGGQQWWTFLNGKLKPTPAFILSGLLWLTQSWGLIALHPCQLSYYNYPTGGAGNGWAADHETSYWADGITRSLFKEAADQIPSGSTLELAPVLHQFQCADISESSPLFARRNWTLTPYKETADLPSGQKDRFVIVYFRYADVPEPFRSLLAGENLQNSKWKLITQTRRGHFVTAAIFKHSLP